MFSNKSFKFVMLIILLTSFTIFSGCGGGNPATPPIDNNDSDSEEIELIEVVSKEINIYEGGVIEVTDPQSELYGLQLIIEPQKYIENNKDTSITPTTHITIYTALLATCILPEHQGYLITPFIIMSDFADLCGSLIILYTDSQLINSGVGKDESVKVCRVRYPLHRSWEEISPLIVSKNIVYVSIGLGDILYYYTLTVENAKPPDSSAFKNPKPGDLLYKFSKFPPLLNINEGWLPGHMGIYVGEKYNEEDGKYNVIEALLFGGVQRNYYNPISKFSGSATYMGARQPKSGPLTSGQRDIIVDWAEAMADLDLPYAWIQTFTSMFYSGLGRGNLVKGTDIFGSFNCVGLAEKAYEIVGVDLVSNFDEGNEDDSPFSILTPAEQWYKTVPIPENLAPIISKLTAVSSSIYINQDINITCYASDPDDDSLTYTWIKTGGTITGSGSTITWTSPVTPDTYTITCRVIDNYGGEDEKSIYIQVGDINVSGSQYVIQWSNAESNGWANPLGEGEELITSTAYDYNSDIYLSNWGKKHTGTDIISELDGNVYSIASGTIVKITRDYSSTSNQSVVIIKHTNSNNEDFFAIYGHVLARGDLEVNSELEVGEKIGTIKKAGSPVHLHFGINLSSKITDFMFTNSDGQWGWGRIPAFANPSDYGWVDPIDYLNTYLLLSSLTPEEVELIRKWGFGGDDIVRRWPDSHVDVYDETNYTRIQDVLNEWNTAIGGPIVFRLSSDPNSPVKVKFDPDLSQDLAGQYLIYCSDDYEFYRADVNIQKNYLDSLDSDTKYCLYLWLFNGAAGFNVQADVDPNPFKEWWIFDKIPDDIKTMLRGLYKVPCGYNLLDKKLKENWTRPIVKNLQNIYEGGLYKLCK